MKTVSYKMQLSCVDGVYRIAYKLTRDADGHELTTRWHSLAKWNRKTRAGILSVQRRIMAEVTAAWDAKDTACVWTVSEFTPPQS